MVEPAPQAKYFHSGIGGAGNYRKLSTQLAVPPARLDAQSTPRPFYGGRGGAGNSHSASERAIFSFDEELLRERTAPIYSVGRGGVGNIVDIEEDNVSLEGDVRNPRLSVSTTGSKYSLERTQSGADRIVQKIKDAIKH